MKGNPLIMTRRNDRTRIRRRRTLQCTHYIVMLQYCNIAALQNCNCNNSTLHHANCILQIATCKLQLANCILPIASCKLHLANCILQISPCKLHLANCIMLSCSNCMLQIACCKLNVTNWMLQIECCKLHVANSMLHIACCKWHVANGMLQMACCKLHFAYCILEIACWKLHVANCKLHEGYKQASKVTSSLLELLVAAKNLQEGLVAWHLNILGSTKGLKADIWWRYGWDMSDMWLKHTWDMAGKWLSYDWDMAEMRGCINFKSAYFFPQPGSTRVYFFPILFPLWALFTLSMANGLTCI